MMHTSLQCVPSYLQSTGNYQTPLPTSDPYKVTLSQELRYLVCVGGYIPEHVLSMLIDRAASILLRYGAETSRPHACHTWSLPQC